MKKLILATMLVSMSLTTYSAYSAQSNDLREAYLRLCTIKKNFAGEVINKKNDGISAEALMIRMVNRPGDTNIGALADLLLVVTKAYSTNKSKSAFADEIYIDCIKEKLQ